MLAYLLIFIIFLLIPAFLNCQPQILWTENYGGEMGEVCRDHIRLRDGGYLLAGDNSDPQGETDFFIVRTDENRDEVWSRTYGGDDGEWCYTAVELDDGSFVLGGITRSYGEGGEEWYVIKINEDGEEIWSRTYGGDHYDACFSIIPLENGNLSLMGYTWSFGAGYKDYWLIEADENGEVVWERTYGGEHFDYGRKHIRTTEGGCAMIGYTISIGHGEKDFGLYLADEDGELLWAEGYGGEFNDDCFAVVQTAGGGFAMAGYTQAEENGAFQACIIKTDSGGEMEWLRTYGGEREDVFYDIAQTEDGGFVAIGGIMSHEGNNLQVYIVRTDREGNLLWQDSYGGELSEEGYSLLKNDSGYNIAGGATLRENNDSQMWMLQTSADPVISFNIMMRQAWSMISAPAQPAYDAFESIWANLIAEEVLVLVKNQNGDFFSPRYDLDEIEAWDARYGYQVLLEQPSSLTIVNQPLPLDTEIPLREGWNIVSYLPNASRAAEEAFGNISDRLLLAKDHHGRFYFPRHNFSNMRSLRRGLGYQVKVDADTELIWNVQRNLMANAQNENYNIDSIQTEHFKLSTGYNANMSLLINIEELPDGYAEIGAFTEEGVCAGVCLAGNGELAGMALWSGNGVSSPVKGFAPGERYSLKLWDGTEETYCAYELIEGSAVYETDGFAFVKLTKPAESANNSALLASFPNPFNSRLKISIRLTEQSPVKLSVFDINGKLVKRLFSGKLDSGGYIFNFNAENQPNGLYIINIESNNLLDSEKVLLMK